MIDPDVLKRDIPLPFMEKITGMLSPDMRLCLVGGCLRDYLLGHSVSDWDLVMEGDLETFVRDLANSTGSSLVALDEKRGIYRVIPRNNPQIYLDIARSRGSIGQDLTLRDFTINAIGLDLKNREILDPSNGIEDLRGRVLRVCHPESIKDDPLRILRGYRLSAGFSLEILGETLSLMMAGREGLRRIAPERIRDELFLMLKMPGSWGVFFQLQKDRVLEIIFPDIIPMEGMAQNSFHRYDVLKHSLECLRQVEILMQSGFSSFGDMGGDLGDYCGKILKGGRSRGQLLKLACLLHDVGKPRSRRVEGGVLYFIGHHEMGKDIWRNIGQELKLSNQEIQMGSCLILHHMDPVFMPQMRDPLRQKESIYRFFWDTRIWAPGVLMLSFADVEAGMGTALRPEMIRIHHQFSLDLARRYFRGDSLAHPPKFLDGNEVIRILGIPPGPGVGKILQDLDRASALGLVADKEGARQFVISHNT